ncbi:unnamed protein product, partial [Prunus brigantina]
MPRPEVELGVEEEAEDPDLARIDLDGVPVRVSVVRSIGEASCSYRRGLPMHPYFYEEGEWSADAVPTRMTHELLERIRREYNMPKDNGELTEDEEGQLEVIRALEASARDATELLSHSSLSASGLLDPVTEAMGIDRNDPRATRQLLERLLKKGPGASRSGPKGSPPARPAGEGAPVVSAPSGEVRRNREEAGKRDAEVKAAVDRAKRMTDESTRKEVEAVRALGAAQVQKAELAKEMGRQREKASQLKDENARLQKALENACKPQAD